MMAKDDQGILRSSPNLGPSAPSWPVTPLAETQPPSDQDLVLAALGDPRAFAPLVRRYEPALRRYAGRLMGRNSALVDDVLQEAFLKAYVNLNEYDRSRPFSPWIYRIVHNEAVSQLRKGKANALMITGEDGERLLTSIIDGSDVQENIDAARNEQRLVAAVASLEPRYRDVIVLRFLEERSYEDIAEILRLPMGTVATLVSRGKERLRKAFGTAEMR